MCVCKTAVDISLNFIFSHGFEILCFSLLVSYFDTRALRDWVMRWVNLDESREKKERNF